ncbi:MAG: TrkH family potassium uptake protein, partial [Candidatus Methanomethylophilus sp.]|nr:TrkH family potassium uptake protein [Methanomethylophilus sp.]
ISSASLNFIRVYALLTVTEIICLMVCDVALFDSVCISFSNVPTGGLLPRNDSMASYGMAAQAVTLVFMILGSANFYMMFRLFFKRDLALLKSRETRIMIEWFLACAFLVFACYMIENTGDYNQSNIGETAWVSLYSVISSGTGTGFAIQSFVYPQFIFLVLMVVEFMGGASGSTAGGIKIYRMMALKSYVMSNINRVMHPNAVISIKADGRNWGEEAVNSALSTIFFFLMGIFISLAILMLIEPNVGQYTPDGVDELQTYFGIILAAIANAGIGPMESYDVLNVGSKLLMCFLMWLGRMEFILVLILFTKGFWSDVRLSVGQFRSSRTSLSDRFDRKR